MRFLLAALTTDGRPGPLLPIAAELRERGHEVHVLAGRSHKARLQAIGAGWLPFIQTRDLDAERLDDELPGRTAQHGVAPQRFDLLELFIPLVPAQVADLERRIDQLRPDALLVDPTFAIAARIVDERHGMPWATCGSVTAPAPRGLAARLRHRVAMRGVEDAYRAMCRLMGTAPVRGGLAAEPASPYLDLPPAVPALQSLGMATEAAGRAARTSADLLEELSGAPRVTVRTSALALA